MLRFNTFWVNSFTLLEKFQYILCYGSTGISKSSLISIAWFQYILCYGSTVVKLKNPDVKDIFQYILCYGSTLWCANKSLASLCISIHPMLRFNYVLNGIDWKQRKFQYILCYGSTPTIKLPKIKKHNFNTSYVTVQPLSLN